MSDYYQILGVPRNASNADITRAYRKLALRWHPDKNPDRKVEAEQRFKEISEAYQVLSDQTKRHQYDRYGQQGSMNGNFGNNYHEYGKSFGANPFHSFFNFRSADDVFREFFGGGTDPFDTLFFQSSGNEQNHSTQDDSTDAFQSTSFASFTTSSSSFSSSDDFSDIGNWANVRQIATSTAYVNGRRVETTKVIDNGNETITTTEDGVLTSVIVNGVPQAIEY